MSWQANVDLVQKLYIAFYGRPADPGGLRYWASQLPDNSAPDSQAVKDLINSFVNSSEAQSRFGSPDLNAAIDRIYNFAFHRNASDAEKGAFAGKTVADVLVSVLSVSSGPDYASLNNKLQYANWFWEYIDPNKDGMPDDDPTTGTKFMATYAGNTDASDIASKLNFVDAANPPLQANVLNDVKSIADTGDAIFNQNQGKTFALTTSVDTLTGTPYDDVFIGDNSAFPPTVQMADSINGGDGNDTFKYYAYNGVMPQLTSIETLDLIGATTGINTTIYTDLKNIIVERWAAAAAQTIKYLSTQSLDFVNNNTKTTAIITLQPDTGSKIAVTLDSNAQLNLSAKATAADATKITELDLTAVGTNKGVTVGPTGNLTTVKILGDGSIELINKAGPIVYDASGNKGGVTVDVTTATNIPFKFIGSSGVDTLKVGVTFTSALDSQLQNVENIVLTDSGLTLNISNQTEGFNITAKGGANIIIGGQGADTIKGGDGADTINGRDGADTIDAGKGNDTIRGGAGADTITTGAGADKVIFDDFRTADKITDFTAGTDKLYIDWAKNSKAANYLLNTKAFALTAGGKVKTVKFVTANAGILATKQPFGTVTWKGVTSLTSGAKAINLGAKGVPLVSAANFTKLYTLLEKVAVTKADANALVFARTSAQGKLYFGAIIDKDAANPGLGTGKITIKTIATVTGNFTANDIFIM